MIIDLNNENLEELISDNIVLIDFYADWCGPCMRIKENIENYIKINKEIKIIKINTDKHSDIAIKYNVMSIPYLILYKNGKKIKENIGYLNEEELKNFIEK